jgi:hypothetical protein
MKKVILLFLIAVVMFSCKKNETTKPDVKKEAEVSFNITTILPDAGRDWDYDIPQCLDAATPDYAKVKIDGIEVPDAGPGGTPTTGYFDVPVFWTNDSLYTQTFKLPVDGRDDCTDYTITEFYLYDASGTMIKAAPAPGSEFMEFVDPAHALPIEFQVCAFTKVEVPIDVLCFEPDFYDLFGFFWFEITEITVREICFFGDICPVWWLDNEDVPLEAWDDVDNLYQYQANGIQADMPAIFTLKLYKEDANGDYVYIRSWNNEYYPNQEYWLGEDVPLCIRYADYDHETDNFMVEMYIYGPWCYYPDGTFCYTEGAQMTWTWTDGDVSGIDLSGDGVVEFAWGDCVQNPEWHLPTQP